MKPNPFCLKSGLKGSSAICLSCGEPLRLHSNWQSLSPFYSHPLLCTECDNLLEVISKENTCVMCSRAISGENELTICPDCETWERDINWQGVLSRNRSLYLYNTAAKDIVYRWKYRGDAVVALVFQERLRQVYIKEFSNYVPIPIPISKKRLQERGFNQSELLVHLISSPYTFSERLYFFLRNKTVSRDTLRLKKSPLLRVLHQEKQSKKSRLERITARENPFRIRAASKKDIQAKQVVLIDDIYTTGTTLRKAASILLNHGAKEVGAITLFRG